MSAEADEPKASPEAHPTPAERVARPPVVWTPEDAANFLRAAIKESQEPLRDALKRQGVPTSLVMLLAILFAAGGFALWQYSQERLAAAQRREKDTSVKVAQEQGRAAAAEAQAAHYQARLQETLAGQQDRLAVLQDDSQRLRDQLITAQKELDAKRGGDQELLLQLASTRGETVKLQGELKERLVMTEKREREILALRRQVTLLTAQLESERDQTTTAQKAVERMRQALAAAAVVGTDTDAAPVAVSPAQSEAVVKPTPLPAAVAQPAPPPPAAKPEGSAKPAEAVSEAPNSRGEFEDQEYRLYERDYHPDE